MTWQLARPVLSNHEMGNSSQLLVLSTSTASYGQCILSWKCRSLRRINRVRTQRDKIGASHRRFYMHACLTLSHCLRHTMHTFASDVMARNWTHAFYSTIIEVVCTLSVSPCPSRDKLATAKLASRSRQARHGRTRRPFYAHHALHEQCCENPTEKGKQTTDKDQTCMISTLYPVPCN